MSLRTMPTPFLRALQHVLTSLDVMPGLAFRVMVELWSRDVFELEDDLSVPAYECASVRGVQ